VSEFLHRALTITEDLVRRYSRRGNYHSEADTADALGLPGLVAQGMQSAGPAYGLLLDAWGQDFLSHGEIDMRFVGVVRAGDTVEARVGVDGDVATFEIDNATTGHTAVVGRARLRHE
jgi:acyl dehydratase